ncbi:MAG: phosphatidylserine/phosphatidylglycerophosphate/cardiolipin synthase family protein [Lachnospiraceae bacterium]|nr:phosphatidylserine/phosphatidylglycerophosphate/cardiolipin synthase family protein [Lachnospiraceae bacterium]
MILLKNGSEAFPEIIRCIRNSKTEILINMFLWRDDSVGNLIASELYRAAERGVKIRIRKDHYGVLSEYGEEDRSSFFVHSLTPKENLESFIFRFIYEPDILFKKKRLSDGRLLKKMLYHPNIKIIVGDFADHSKFFIFDRKIIIFGGVNIEDRHFLHDRRGRNWRDFMVRIDDSLKVAGFLKKRRGIRSENAEMFSMNIKLHGRRFELKDTLLGIINSSEKELTIIMAYFTPLPEFLEAIKKAVLRGVSVRICLPQNSNILKASDIKTASILLKYSKLGDIKIYLAPDMIHAKIIMNEKELTMGSCNLTARSLDWLGELNLFTPNEDNEFCREVRKAAEEIITGSKPVPPHTPLLYDPLLAVLEAGMI